jgi:hypothetical protein
MPDYTKHLRDGRLQRILGRPTSGRLSSTASSFYSLDDEDHPNESSSVEIREVELDRHIANALSTPLSTESNDIAPPTSSG